MNRLNLSLISGLCLSAVSLSAGAQDIPAEILAMFRPTVGDSIQSVEVTAPGEVTFRIYAPDAQRVSVTGDLGYFGPLAPQLEKDDRGVWQGTARGVEPGVYRYQFVVDGVKVNDPKSEVANETRPMLEYDPSGEAFWAVRDVPHGAVSTIYYPSATTGETRRMHIWTPAGYNHLTEPLPVLYLIHGGGDNDAAWTGVGRANFILDNLLADGQMVPMLVVMPDGSIDTGLFTQELMNDVIPYVEANYQVLTDKDHRAVAGLSMGGLETLDVSLSHYEAFSYAFPLSTGWFIGSAFYDQWEPYLKENAQAINQSYKIYKFFMGGETDIAHRNGIATREVFDRCGVKYDYDSMEGGHSWTVWRHNLRDIAPLLFR